MERKNLKSLLESFHRPFFVAEVFEKALEERLRKKGLSESAKFIVRRVGTKVPDVRAVEVGLLSSPLAVYPALEAFKDWHRFEKRAVDHAKREGWDVLRIRKHPGPSQYLIWPGGAFDLPRASNIYPAKKEVDKALRAFSSKRSIQAVQAKYYGFEKNKKFFTPYSDLDWELKIVFSDFERGKRDLERLLHKFLDIEKKLGTKVVPYKISAFAGMHRIEDVYKETLLRMIEKRIKKPGPGFEPG